MTFDTTQYDMLKPLVSGWLAKIELAKRHRKPWLEVAEDCAMFYSGASGFMWDARYKQKFWDNKATPKFRITIAKAFELVALFGPVLYHRNPHRATTPKTTLEIQPDLFGAQDDPAAQAIYQQAMAQQASESSRSKLMAELMGRYLNYTPGEQPEGGLKEHSELAITDALIKGRGCQWVESYKTPTGRTLTGCFYDHAENLLTDPDASKWDFSSMWWVAKECTHPIWQVEREYGLKPDSLKGKGNTESSWSQGETSSDWMRSSERKDGKTFDCITYYKIWSRGGVGARLSGVNTVLKSALDRVVGDFAYLVIAPSVDFPLNAPTEKLRSGTDADVASMFHWPIPYWTDSRWPVSILDFYKKPNSSWPIAPLAPGLGELKFINVMISHLANRIWTSSRDFWAVSKSACADLKSYLEEGSDQCVIPIGAVAGGVQEVDKVLKVLQQPQTNMDVWRILEAVMELFDKRVGLSELLYGLNPGGTQMRSAAEATGKRESVSIRPDYMASRVEDWQSEAARMESFCAAWYVQPQDVAPLIGQVGAHFWGQLISGRPMQDVVAEMDVTIAAGSARKPNKDRDVANLQQAMPVLMPELTKHADVTTDTGPVNSLIKSWGKANDIDVSEMQLGPRMPPPPPPGTPNPMEMEMQLKQQEMQFEQQKAELDAQGQQAKLQMEQQKHQMELVFRKAEMDMEERRFQMEMQQSAIEFQQGLAQDQAQGKLDLTQAKQAGAQKMQDAKQQAALKKTQATTNGKPASK